MSPPVDNSRLFQVATLEPANVPVPLSEDEDLVEVCLSDVGSEEEQSKEQTRKRKELEWNVITRKRSSSKAAGVEEGNLKKNPVVRKYNPKTSATNEPRKQKRRKAALNPCLKCGDAEEGHDCWVSKKPWIRCFNCGEQNHVHMACKLAKGEGRLKVRFDVQKGPARENVEKKIARLQQQLVAAVTQQVEERVKIDPKL
eukprot:GHVP01018049.1.p1 GENE.GHVP01018049.1~~GHVP01018049.1.p1  ORF type:complete len:199 (+),score=33.40 GHVP01018049.1:258-854(+)